MQSASYVNWEHLSVFTIPFGVLCRYLNLPDIPSSLPQFWRLLKDCELYRCGLTLYAADATISPSSSPPYSPTETFLMREFLQALVFIAHTIYWDASETDRYMIVVL